MIFCADTISSSAVVAACREWVSSTEYATKYEGYGSSLKQRCRSTYGTYIGFAGRGEMIPNENSYCDLDPETVDQWGIPVLRFHWQVER